MKLEKSVCVCDYIHVRTRAHARTHTHTHTHTHTCPQHRYHSKEAKIQQTLSRLHVRTQQPLQQNKTAHSTTRGSNAHGDTRVCPMVNSIPSQHTDTVTHGVLSFICNTLLLVLYKTLHSAIPNCISDEHGEIAVCQFVLSYSMHTLSVSHRPLVQSGMSHYQVVAARTDHYQH